MDRIVRKSFLPVCFFVTMLCVYAQAQLLAPIVNFGKPRASYVGPGDVIGSAKAWYGTRCYQSAYTGNMLDIWDSATGSTTETLLTCSAGNVINQTVNALSVTCAVACDVKEAYDMSGNGLNATQATNSQRPTFTQNFVNGKSCMTFARGSSQFLYNGTGSSVSQPLSMAVVAERTGSTTSNSSVLVVGSNGPEIYFYTSANTVGIYAQSGYTATANDNVLHNFAGLITSSGKISVDGSVTTGSIGAQAAATNIVLGASNNSGSNALSGVICEAGLWSGDQSASFGTLNTNQAAYY
jgi:hypothetical protein